VWAGSLVPSLLEQCRRIDRSLFVAVMEAYVHAGVDVLDGRPGEGAGHGQRDFAVGDVEDLR
jgi:hypothetical protein